MQKSIIILVFIVIMTPTNLYSLDSKPEKVEFRKNKKLSVDDIDFFSEGYSIGIAYAYSSVYPANTLFPLNIYAHYSFNGDVSRFFLISAELGVNLDKNTYGQSKPINPKFHSQLGIGAKFRYFSLQCSFGVVGGSSKETKKAEESSIIVTLTYDNVWSGFICQPSINVYIPQAYLMFKVGYNIVPSLPELNGLTIGIGVLLDEDML